MLFTSINFGKASDMSFRKKTKETAFEIKGHWF